MIRMLIKLSPSKVDTFLGCRRLYAYRYFLKPFVPLEKKQFLIGNIAHKALQNFHTSLNTSQDGVDVTTLMKDSFREALNSHHFKEKLDRRTIVKNDLLDIRGMISSYLKLYKNLKEKPAVVSIEKYGKIIKDELEITLKADRVDKPEDGIYRVVDYKTSSKPASKKDELSSVQIPTYKIWVAAEFDKNAKVYGDYYYLRHLGNGGIHSFEITDEMVETALRKYTFVKDALKNGCTMEKNTKYKFCFICEYKTYCWEDKKLHSVDPKEEV